VLTVLKKNKTKHQPALFANETSKPSNILFATTLFLTKRNNSAVLIIGKSKKDLMNSLKTCQLAARLAEKWLGSSPEIENIFEI
jgi:hypothetical protein